MTIAGTSDTPTRDGPRPPGVLTHGRPETTQSLADIASLLPEFVERTGSDNPFFDPAFLAPAAAALGASIELITVNDAAGRLLAMLPTERTKLGRLAPSLRAFSHNYAPLGVPLIDASTTRESAASLIDGALERAGPAAGLVLPELVETDGATDALRDAARSSGRSVTTVDRYQRAGLDRDRDGTNPRQSLSRRRRKEYARQLRRMSAEGPVAFEHAVTQADVTQRFDDFVALEASGWKGRRRTAMAANPPVAAFAREAVQSLARRSAASIVTLRLGNHVAAMLICLHHGHTAFTWKIAYDEALSHFSPGAQVMLEAPRFLFANDAITRIDSCATENHPMVDHIWAGRIQMVTLVIGPEKNRWRNRWGIATHRAETVIRRSATRARNSLLSPRR
ncbi:MAG: GNAT family N-acetyltransferase [Alphaproteobacteria bacterium]